MPFGLSGRKVFLKTVAALLIFAFLLTDTATGLSPVFANPSGENPAPAPIRPATFHIPENTGQIRSLYSAAPDAPFVVVLQDAHAVREAQQSIQQILSGLAADYEISLVLLEGGSGKMDATLLQSFPDENLKRITMQKYMARAEVAGAQLAAVQSENRQEFYGIEDWPVYEENFLAYHHAVRRQPEIAAQLKAMRDALAAPSAADSRSLQAFHEKARGLSEDTETLFEFAQFLGREEGYFKKNGRDSEDYPALAAIISAVRKQGGAEPLDAAVRRLAERFRREASERLNADQAREFSARHQDYLAGRLDAGGFLHQIENLALQSGAAFTLSPEMRELVRINRTLTAVRGTKFSDEIERFIAETENRLIQTETQRQWIENSWRMVRLGKLARLELTRAELARYQTAENEHMELAGPARELLLPALEYYRLVTERDEALYRNFKKRLSASGRDRAVILAGGFHTEALTQRLEADGISYAVVMPQMSSIDGSENYAAVMRGDLSFRSSIRTTIYDAFMRQISAELAAGLDGPGLKRTLKLWREEIIRRMAAAGDAGRSGEYTRYIDPLFRVYDEKFGGRTDLSREDFLKALRAGLEEERDRSLAGRWENFESRLKEWTAGLHRLAAAGRLERQAVLSLWEKSAAPAAFMQPVPILAFISQKAPAVGISRMVDFFSGRSDITAFADDFIGYVQRTTRLPEPAAREVALKALGGSGAAVKTMTPDSGQGIQLAEAVRRAEDAAAAAQRAAAEARLIYESTVAKKSEVRLPPDRQSFSSLFQEMILDPLIEDSADQLYLQYDSEMEGIAVQKIFGEMKNGKFRETDSQRRIIPMNRQDAAAFFINLRLLTKSYDHPGHLLPYGEGRIEQGYLLYRDYGDHEIPGPSIITDGETVFESPGAIVEETHYYELKARTRAQDGFLYGWFQIEKREINADAYELYLPDFQAEKNLANDFALPALLDGLAEIHILSSHHLPLPHRSLDDVRSELKKLIHRPGNLTVLDTRLLLDFFEAMVDRGLEELASGMAYVQPGAAPEERVERLIANLLIFMNFILVHSDFDRAELMTKLVILLKKWKKHFEAHDSGTVEGKLLEGLVDSRVFRQFVSTADAPQSQALKSWFERMRITHLDKYVHNLTRSEVRAPRKKKGAAEAPASSPAPGLASIIVDPLPGESLPRFILRISEDEQYGIYIYKAIKRLELELPENASKRVVKDFEFPDGYVLRPGDSLTYFYPDSRVRVFYDTAAAEAAKPPPPKILPFAPRGEEEQRGRSEMRQSSDKVSEEELQARIRDYALDFAARLPGYAAKGTYWHIDEKKFIKENERRQRVEPDEILDPYYRIEFSVVRDRKHYSYDIYFYRVRGGNTIKLRVFRPGPSGNILIPFANRLELESLIAPERLKTFQVMLEELEKGIDLSRFRSEVRTAPAPDEIYRQIETVFSNPESSVEEMTAALRRIPYVDDVWNRAAVIRRNQQILFGEHTETVMELFESYPKNHPLPGGFDPALFRFMLAVHDLGKVEANAAGLDQFTVTVRRIRDLFAGRLSWDIEDAIALIENDAVGLFFQPGKISDEEVLVQLGASAARAELDFETYFRLKSLYHQLDILSYSSLGSNVYPLEYAFRVEEGRPVFHPEEIRFFWSDAFETAHARLRDLVQRRSEVRASAFRKWMEVNRRVFLKHAGSLLARMGVRLPGTEEPSSLSALDPESVSFPQLESVMSGYLQQHINNLLPYRTVPDYEKYIREALEMWRLGDNYESSWEEDLYEMPAGMRAASFAFGVNTSDETANYILRALPDALTGIEREISFYSQYASPDPEPEAPTEFDRRLKSLRERRKELRSFIGLPHEEQLRLARSVNLEPMLAKIREHYSTALKNFRIVRDIKVNRDRREEVRKDAENDRHRAQREAEQKNRNAERGSFGTPFDRLLRGEKPVSILSPAYPVLMMTASWVRRSEMRSGAEREQELRQALDELSPRSQLEVRKEAFGTLNRLIHQRGARIKNLADAEPLFAALADPDSGVRVGASALIANTAGYNSAALGRLLDVLRQPSVDPGYLEMDGYQPETGILNARLAALFALGRISPEKLDAYFEYFKTAAAQNISPQSVESEREADLIFSSRAPVELEPLLVAALEMGGKHYYAREAVLKLIRHFPELVPAASRSEVRTEAEAEGVRDEGEESLEAFAARYPPVLKIAAVRELWEGENADQYGRLKQLILKYRHVRGMRHVVQRLAAGLRSGNAANFAEVAGELFVADALMEALIQDYDVQILALGSNIGFREFDIFLKVTARPGLARAPGTLADGLYIVEAKEDASPAAVIEATLANQVPGQLENLRLLEHAGLPLRGVIVAAGGINGTDRAVLPLKRENLQKNGVTTFGIPVYSTIVPRFDVKQDAALPDDGETAVPDGVQIRAWANQRTDIVSLFRDIFSPAFEIWPLLQNKEEGRRAARALARLQRREGEYNRRVEKIMQVKAHRREEAAREQERRSGEIQGWEESFDASGITDERRFEILDWYFNQNLPLEALRQRLQEESQTDIRIPREQRVRKGWDWLRTEYEKEMQARLAQKPAQPVRKKETGRAPQPRVPKTQDWNAEILSQRIEKNLAGNLGWVKSFTERAVNAAGEPLNLLPEEVEPILREYFSASLKVPDAEKQKDFRGREKDLRNKIAAEGWEEVWQWLQERRSEVRALPGPDADFDAAVENFAAAVWPAVLQKLGLDPADAEKIKDCQLCALAAPLVTRLAEIYFVNDPAVTVEPWGGVIRENQPDSSVMFLHMWTEIEKNGRRYYLSLMDGQMKVPEWAQGPNLQDLSGLEPADKYSFLILGGWTISAGNAEKVIPAKNYPRMERIIRLAAGMQDFFGMPDLPSWVESQAQEMLGAGLFRSEVRSFTERLSFDLPEASVMSDDKTEAPPEIYVLRSPEDQVEEFLYRALGAQWRRQVRGEPVLFLMTRQVENEIRALGVTVLRKGGGIIRVPFADPDNLNDLPDSREWAAAFKALRKELARDDKGYLELISHISSGQEKWISTEHFDPQHANSADVAPLFYETVRFVSPRGKQPRIDIHYHPRITIDNTTAGSKRVRWYGGFHYRQFEKSLVLQGRSLYPVKGYPFWMANRMFFQSVDHSVPPYEVLPLRTEDQKDPRSDFMLEATLDNVFKLIHHMIRERIKPKRRNYSVMPWWFFDVDVRFSKDQIRLKVKEPSKQFSYEYIMRLRRENDDKYHFEHYLITPEGEGGIVVDEGLKGMVHALARMTYVLAINDENQGFLENVPQAFEFEPALARWLGRSEVRMSQGPQSGWLPPSSRPKPKNYESLWVEEAGESFFSMPESAAKSWRKDLKTVAKNAESLVLRSQVSWGLPVEAYRNVRKELGTIHFEIVLNNQPGREAFEFHLIDRELKKPGPYIAIPLGADRPRIPFYFRHAGDAHPVALGSIPPALFERNAADAPDGTDPTDFLQSSLVGALSEILGGIYVEDFLRPVLPRHLKNAQHYFIGRQNVLGTPYAFVYSFRGEKSLMIIPHSRHLADFALVHNQEILTLGEFGFHTFDELRKKFLDTQALLYQGGFFTPALEMNYLFSGLHSNAGDPSHEEIRRKMAGLFFGENTQKVSLQILKYGQREEYSFRFNDAILTRKEPLTLAVPPGQSQSPLVQMLVVGRKVTGMEEVPLDFSPGSMDWSIPITESEAVGGRKIPPVLIYFGTTRHPGSRSENDPAALLIYSNEPSVRIYDVTREAEDIIVDLTEGSATHGLAKIVPGPEPQQVLILNEANNEALQLDVPAAGTDTGEINNVLVWGLARFVARLQPVEAHLYRFRSEVRSQKAMTARIRRIVRDFARIPYDDLMEEDQIRRYERLNQLLARIEARGIRPEIALEIYTAFLPEQSPGLQVDDEGRAMIPRDSPEVVADIVRFYERIQAMIQSGRAIHERLLASVIIGLIHNEETVRRASVDTLLVLSHEQRKTATPLLIGMARSPETSPMILFSLLKVLNDAGSDGIKYLLPIIRNPEAPGLLVREAVRVLSENPDQQQTTAELTQIIFDLSAMPALQASVVGLAEHAPIHIAAPALTALLGSEDSEIVSLANRVFEDHLAGRIDDMLNIDSDARRNYLESKRSEVRIQLEGIQWSDLADADEIAEQLQTGTRIEAVEALLEQRAELNQRRAEAFWNDMIETIIEKLGNQASSKAMTAWIENEEGGDTLRILLREILNRHGVEEPEIVTELESLVRETAARGILLGRELAAGPALPLDLSALDAPVRFLLENPEVLRAAWQEWAAQSGAGTEIPAWREAYLIDAEFAGNDGAALRGVMQRGRLALAYDAEEPAMAEKARGLVRLLLEAAAVSYQADRPVTPAQIQRAVGRGKFFGLLADNAPVEGVDFSDLLFAEGEVVQPAVKYLGGWEPFLRLGQVILYQLGEASSGRRRLTQETLDAAIAFMKQLTLMQAAQRAFAAAA